MQTMYYSAEGSASIDAASHRGGEKEERSYRRQQDLRLSTVRFSAGVLHGLELVRRLDESTFRVIRHPQTHRSGAVLFGK